MVLNLTVLNRSGAQKLVELDGINSSCTLFVLSGLGADPEVYIITQRAPHLLCLQKRMKNSVPNIFCLSRHGTKHGSKDPNLYNSSLNL